MVKYFVRDHDSNLKKIGIELTVAHINIAIKFTVPLSEQGKKEPFAIVPDLA
jgi:hypothetical protein